MNATFCLFRLPVLALKEVLKCLTPIELFELSQCSRKASQIVRIVGKLSIELDFYRCYIVINEKQFIFAYGKPKEKDVVGIRKFQNNSVNVAFDSEDEMFTYWENRITGIEQVFCYFIDVFNCTVAGINSHRKVPWEVLHFCLQITPKHELKEFELAADELTNENVTWVLENVKVTERLWISQKLSDDFNYNGKPFDAKCVTLFHSSWIKLDHLSQLLDKCVMLQLWESLWNNEEVVEFIRLWRAGKFPNLQNFILKSENLDENLKIDGLDALEDTVARAKFSRKIGDQIMMIHSGVPIKRDDGSIGQIRYFKNEGEVHLFI
ncbi:hypothetical protein CAEBREN_18662 [Caenorhabditis brenneri]|uniref:F-box domain-containing protein n=1 Tax=Caenorhabditis brenneri TaxID=135651 RepID=G0NQS0_CAEBE|nr:hypothetical protein CAEBREN_18662 [Caenorhabditis brenneri]